MPELPDVEIFKQYLDSTSLHKRVEDVSIIDGGLLEGISGRQFRRRLKGEQFESTRRHGKYLFVRLKNGHMVLHFGMTGYLEYYRSEEDRPDKAKILWQFANGYRLACISGRKLGSVKLIENPDKFIEQHDLGPDPLNDDIEAGEFVDLYHGRRGTVKAGLMNQSVLAGIGNVYSDEVLFRAGIHPGTKLKSLDPAALKKLYRTMRDVLDTTIHCRADPSRFPRAYLTPRRKPGAECPKCGGAIRRVTVSGRSSFFCDTHQRHGT